VRPAKKPLKMLFAGGMLMLSKKKFSSETLEQLKVKVTGSVVLPGDSGYDKQRTPWLEVVEQHPSAIVNAHTVQDIAEAVRAARDLNLPLGVQNTGHGIAAPCNEGILLRLSEMKDIAVDAAAGTATVGPGVSSGELIAAAEPHGLAYPSGQVSNVGAIGYTLGGGYGWLGRKVGAACYAVQSATVVLADGSVVVASADENPDLFWAIRGGGGNFGVIASMTVELVRLGQIFGGIAYYRMEDAPEVFRFYREWSAGLSDDTSTYLRLMQVPPQPAFLLHLHSLKTCAIGVCHASPATAEKLHEQIRAFKVPALDDLKLRPYSEMAGFDEASDTKGSPTFSHVECLQELSDAVLDKVLEIAKTSFPPLLLVELQHLGGALKHEQEDAVAYTAPKASFYFKVVSPTMQATLEELAPITMEAVHSLGPVYTEEFSYNWLRGDQQNLVPAAFGAEKYKRLQELKRQFDPTNLFRLNLNIPPN